MYLINSYLQTIHDKVSLKYTLNSLTCFMLMLNLKRMLMLNEELPLLKT